MPCLLTRVSHFDKTFNVIIGCWNSSFVIQCLQQCLFLPPIATTSKDGCPHNLINVCLSKDTGDSRLLGIYECTVSINKAISINRAISIKYLLGKNTCVLLHACPILHLIGKIEIQKTYLQ